MITRAGQLVQSSFRDQGLGHYIHWNTPLPLSTHTPKTSPVAHRAFWEHRWRQRGARGPGKAVTLSHTGWQDGRASVTSADISPGLSGAVSESLVHGLVSDVMHSVHTLSAETSGAQPPLKTTQLTSPRANPTEASRKPLGLHQTCALSAAL